MKNQRRILIIEDNPDDEALLLRQLKKAGLGRHVKVINNGGIALEYLTDEQLQCEDIAAVFLDLNLPRIGGLKLLEVIRSRDRTRDIPVIVMTSSNAPEELEKCRKLGASAYVRKPLTVSTFAKALADSFHVRRAGAPIGRESGLALSLIHDFGRSGSIR